MVLLRQYFQSGALFTACMQFLLLGKSKTALELLRMSAKLKTKQTLKRRYKKKIRAFKEHYQAPQDRVHSRKIWVCWFQGIENAPPLVQRCYRSLQEHLQDREIVLITSENYRQYVTFPENIQQKIDAGIIGATHLSDLLRLELLLQYGGTWIDATVFCSGGQIPSYMLDSDLFLFQNLKPGSNGQATCISNWFITARSHNPLLAMTQALLYDYWSSHNNLIDYFIFHLFFQLATEAYPEQWRKVIPFPNSAPHILLLRLFEPYERETWQAVAAMTPFHKLTYKFKPEDPQRPGTYYEKLIC